MLSGSGARQGGASYSGRVSAEGMLRERGCIARGLGLADTYEPPHAAEVSASGERSIAARHIGTAISGDVLPAESLRAPKRVEAVHGPAQSRTQSVHRSAGHR